MMDLSAVLSSFAGTYTVTRTGSVIYGTDGRPVAPAPTTFSIQAVVIPMSGRDIFNLPEGMRAGDYRWVYSSTQLFTQQTATSEPDMITIDGALYQVNKVMQYSVLGNYWQYLVQMTGN